MLLAEHKWYRLNDTNVTRAPRSSGVYELSGTGAVVVYIGFAEDMALQDKLRGHIRDATNSCIEHNAYFFRFELSQRPRERAEELVQAYRKERYGILPECMQQPETER